MNRSRAVLPLVLTVTTAVAFVPSAWLGWTTRLSDVVRIPLMPVSQLGTSAAAWLRPAAIDQMKATEVEVLRAALDKETRTSEQYRQMYDREHQEAMRLAALLAELSQLPDEVIAGAGPPIVADTPLTARSGSDGTGVVELLMPPAQRGRVTLSTIAVYAGVNLLGRVSDVSNFRIMLTPITNTATGWVKGVVRPQDQTQWVGQTAQRIQLRAAGDGTLAGDSPQSGDVAVGDLVILDDPKWPAWSQAMVLGVVESVSAKESEPLLNQVVVRPRYGVHEVSYVTLLVGADSGEASAGAPAPGEKR